MAIMDVSLRLVKMKADQGDAESQNTMAEAYLFGEGVPRCQKKSLKYHLLLIDHGPLILNQLTNYDAIASEIGNIEFELGNPITAENWFLHTKEYIEKAAVDSEFAQERLELLGIEGKINYLRSHNYKLVPRNKDETLIKRKQPVHPLYEPA
jgi:TPR repeat protein